MTARMRRARGVSCVAALAAVSFAAEAERPPRTAFLMVGAAYDCPPEVFDRYRRHVVDAYGGVTDTYALIKAVHFHGERYQSSRTSELVEKLEATLSPKRLAVSPDDPTPARFERYSRDAIDCLWPRPFKGKYSAGLKRMPLYYDDAELDRSRRRFIYWWGAMQMAWDMVEEVEAAEGFRYDQVIFIRVGTDVARDMPGWQQLRAHEFYTQLNVPDMLWVMSRRVAARMLQTASKVVACTEAENCCLSLRTCLLRWSWWIPCYWLKTLLVEPGALPRLGQPIMHSNADAGVPADGACFPYLDSKVDDPKLWAAQTQCGGPAFDGDFEADFGGHRTADKNQTWIDYLLRKMGKGSSPDRDRVSTFIVAHGRPPRDYSVPPP